MTRNAHVYGPVASRRLGLSLGVDLVPFKYCPYNCIYCQLGPTRVRTRQRQAFYSREEILREIRTRLDTSRPDYITLSGSGEPTLYSELGALIRDIKATTAVPVALLTNGALLGDREVRREAALADLVLPSLDAADADLFQRVNRPMEDLDIESVIEGLVEFRREYQDPIWLEIMAVNGLTTEGGRLEKIAGAVGRIAPDRIQLNTPVRPVPGTRLEPVSHDVLREMAEAFSPAAEIIAPLGARRVPNPPLFLDTQEVHALIQRRPCTVEDIAAGLGAPANLVVKALELLRKRGLVRSARRRGQLYYKGMPE